MSIPENQEQEVIDQLLQANRVLTDANKQLLSAIKLLFLHLEERTLDEFVQNAQGDRTTAS